MANRPYHTTKFVVWWDQLDGNTGHIRRIEREFKRKEEAAVFIRKQPAIDRHLAGCFMLEESQEVARDGKVTITTVKADVWTYDEIRDLALGRAR